MSVISSLGHASDYTTAQAHHSDQTEDGEVVDVNELAGFPHVGL